MSMPLTRQRVLKTAVRLADKDGIESLSMRKLARSLGVEAMSLYNHVANKGDLVDAMFELVMTEVELPPDSERWDTAIRSYAIAMHDALLRHPWAGNLAVGLGGGGVRGGRPGGGRRPPPVPARTDRLAAPPAARRRLLARARLSRLPRARRAH